MSEDEMGLLDAIDAWHERRPDMSLPAWLGWAREEYAAWVEGGPQPAIRPDAPCALASVPMQSALREIGRTSDGVPVYTTGSGRVPTTAAQRSQAVCLFACYRLRAAAAPTPGEAVAKALRTRT